MTERVLAFTGRVQSFEYNTHFFLPANPLSGVPNREVFMRFEEAQSVHEFLIDKTRFTSRTRCSSTPKRGSITT